MSVVDPTIVKVQEDIFSCECGKCEAKTHFHVKYSLENEDDSLIEAFGDLFAEYYHFCVCSVCSKFFTIIYEHELQSELYGFILEYPIDKRHIEFNLPEIVKDSYKEAVKCEKAGAFLATAVMVGRALEAIIKEKTNKRGIHDGLGKLKEDGIISKEIFDWSNELRILRNIGAHAEQKQISKVDAEEALDFLQAILEILYHLRPKFLKFRERRQTQTNSD